LARVTAADAAVGLAVSNLGASDNSPYLAAHRAQFATGRRIFEMHDHPELPLDPDTENIDLVGATRARPLHLRASSIALVFVGGTLGVAAREGLSLAFPTTGMPWTIFAINVAGALVLGVLLEALARSGPDEGRGLRLLAGTGFLGGFTTYSALAVDATALLAAGDATAGIGYGLLTVLVGGVATFAGILVASLRRPARSEAAR
jgi:CrcB protein